MDIYSSAGLKLKSFAELLHYRSRMVFYGSVGKYKTVEKDSPWVLFVVVNKHQKRGTFSGVGKRSVTKAFQSLECMELNEDFTLKNEEKFYLSGEDTSIEEIKMIGRGDTTKVLSFGVNHDYPAFGKGKPLWSPPKVIHPKNAEKHRAQDAVKMARVALAALIAVVERDETYQTETLGERIAREKSTLSIEQRRAFALALLS